jgi:hypothetical protein
VTSRPGGADPASAQRTGICIVRVETEVNRLLITVTTERYLHRGLAMAGGREVSHFADPAEALREVETFIRSHQPHGVVHKKPSGDR